MSKVKAGDLMVFNSYSGEVYSEACIGKFHGGLTPMTRDTFPIFANGRYAGFCSRGQLIRRNKRKDVVMWFDPKTGQICEENSAHATGIPMTEDVTPIYFDGHYIGYTTKTRAVLRT